MLAGARSTPPANHRKNEYSTHSSGFLIFQIFFPEFQIWKLLIPEFQIWKSIFPDFQTWKIEIPDLEFWKINEKSTFPDPEFWNLGFSDLEFWNLGFPDLEFWENIWKKGNPKEGLENSFFRWFAGGVERAPASISCIILLQCTEFLLQKIIY